MKARKADAVLTEIVRNGVIAVTEEMKTNLMRTAYNMIIYEALDFTTGLFTPEGDTVSIGIGLPSFIRGMANTVRAKLDHYGIHFPERITWCDAKNQVLRDAEVSCRTDRQELSHPFNEAEEDRNKNVVQIDFLGAWAPTSSAISAAQLVDGPILRSTAQTR